MRQAILVQGIVLLVFLATSAQAALISFTIPVIEIKELSSDDPMLITVAPDVKAELNTLFQITYR